MAIQCHWIQWNVLRSSCTMPRTFAPIWNKSGVPRHIFVKVSNIKYHGNTSTGTRGRAGTCGQADGYGEDWPNRRLFLTMWTCIQGKMTCIEKGRIEGAMTNSYGQCGMYKRRIPLRKSWDIDWRIQLYSNVYNYYKSHWNFKGKYWQFLSLATI